MALSELAYGSTERSAAVITAGAIPALVQLLQSPESDDFLKDRAVEALETMAANNAQCNVVLRVEALPSLLQLCTDDAHGRLQCGAARALSNMCWSVIQNFEIDRVCVCV